MAFDVLDRDGSGVVDATDVALIYDPSQHPMVLSGVKTPEQVLREFLDTFDVGGEVDGKVTREEFVNYYTNISASIDREDYFELMIRNAWHIEGGKGVAANSTNKRVLVTRRDGSQGVQVINNDLGIKADNKEGMVARLRAQGVDAATIELYGGVDNTTKPATNPSAPSFGKPSSFSPKRLTKVPGQKGTRYSVSTAPATGDIGTQVSMTQQGSSSNQGSRSNLTAPPKVNPYVTIITDVKELMKKRGSNGLIGLQRKFRAMDKDGSKSLSKMEFRNAIADLGMRIKDSEIFGLFDYFDMDRSGSVDFEEFLQSLRDPLGMKRLQLIHMAFNVIDTDGSGIVDAAEVATLYDATKHPAVVTGAKSKEQVLREFLDTFDVGGEVDGKVTRQEFVNYYTNISSSIENDEYFELMIRNAWHIEGGEGTAANSANRRVLVTREDGSQGVEVIKHDLGLKADDKEGMVARLRAQGVDAQSIDLFGGVEMEDTREDALKTIPADVAPAVADMRKEALGKFNAADYEGAMACFETLLATLQNYLTMPEGMPDHPDVVKVMKSIKLTEKKLHAQQRQGQKPFGSR
jgi:Ca2+-binding EF-hand superfamily protein